jgi:heterodisulfide reductase subunit B
LKDDLEREMGIAYHESVEVLSLLDLIEQRVGAESVRARVTQPLQGLRVACYYGCLLTRPPSITGAEDPEYPMAMDRLVQALGAEPVAWDSKVSCCGASLALTNLDIVVAMGRAVLENARARGADVVAVACPLCHSNLDTRQNKMNLEAPMPVLYITQLMALAFGLAPRAALHRNLTDPRPVLAAKGFAVHAAEPGVPSAATEASPLPPALA